MGKASKKKSVKKAAEIPLECTLQEYKVLTSQVANLTQQEAQEELMECARYGEVDAVRALLERFPDSIVNAVDDSGSTALHKACANGHVSVTQLLIRNGASLKTNHSGNTPLHWAAASGRAQVIELLLNEPTYNVNVLQKNDFGRSILTEGFSSQCTEVVKLLLEHDSASEEKLLSGGQEVSEEAEELEKNDNDDGKESPPNVQPRKTNATIVHDFSLCDDTDNTQQKPLRIRELPIAHADNPFGKEAIDDTTGSGIWCASLVMARWISSKEMQCRFRNKTILELGAGCGIPGLAAAHYSDATRVYLTDLNPTTMKNLQFNIDLNFDNKAQAQVIARTMDWDDETTWPKEKIDYVIGSDLIYQASIVPLLKKVVLGLLQPDRGRFLYVAPDTGRDGLSEFIDTMRSEGCDLVDMTQAPKSFHSNPLSSGDEEDCFLHFNELASSKYMLYEFRYSSAD